MNRSQFIKLKAVRLASRAVLLAAVCLLAQVGALGAAAPHQIKTVRRLDCQQVRLTLRGRLAGDFQEYFDLFPLETSSDLQNWEVTGTILRTNSVSGSIRALQPNTNQVGFLRTPASSPKWSKGWKRCRSGHVDFFRTPTNACPTAFPKPTGPYLVGTVSRLFASATRNSTELGTNREFMVSVFYPAMPASWRQPDLVFEPSYGPILFSYEFLTNPRPVGVITNLLSHALPGLPVLTGTNSFPVLIYCHGGGYFRRDNIHKMTELASHGYIVVSADYDAYYSYLPDGTVVYGTGNNSVHPWFVLDTQFILDQLESMNMSDPQFAGRLDLARIGIVGWSIGGATAAGVSYADPRIKAAVLYDAAFWAAPEVTSSGLNKPFLCINATTELEPGWSAPAIALFNQATQDAMFFQIDGTYHTEFSDIILMDYPGVTERQRTALIVDYTRAFFNHYLLGTTEPLLNAPTSNGATIVNWLKK